MQGIVRLSNEAGPTVLHLAVPIPESPPESDAGLLVMRGGPSDGINQHTTSRAKGCLNRRKLSSPNLLNGGRGARYSSLRKSTIPDSYHAESRRLTGSRDAIDTRVRGRCHSRYRSGQIEDVLVPPQPHTQHHTTTLYVLGGGGGGTVAVTSP